MTVKEKAEFKKRLYEKCIDIIEQRITESLHAMNNSQAAANAEEKSSAGDKYETSRAMSHLEKDMHAKQLEANRKELSVLLNTGCSRQYKSAAAGSIVQCTGMSFFIIAGLGKINFEDKIVFLLSPYAPMARSLFNKKNGSKFIFNKKEELITDIF